MNMVADIVKSSRLLKCVDKRCRVFDKKLDLTSNWPNNLVYLRQSKNESLLQIYNYSSVTV